VAAFVKPACAGCWASSSCGGIIPVRDGADARAHCWSFGRIRVQGSSEGCSPQALPAATKGTALRLANCCGVSAPLGAGPAVQPAALLPAVEPTTEGSWCGCLLSTWRMPGGLPTSAQPPPNLVVPKSMPTDCRPWTPKSKTQDYRLLSGCGEGAARAAAPLSRPRADRGFRRKTCGGIKRDS